MTTDIKSKTVILVNGVPASGKSSISRILTNHFKLPYLAIDAIKEPFMAQFEEIDRLFNRRLGYAAYEVIWSIIEKSPPGCIFIVDAWFGFQSKEVLQQYLKKAEITKVLEVWNQIPGSVASSRYAQRLDQRKNGHPGEEYLPELSCLADKALPMGIGPVYTVDQSTDINQEQLIQWIECNLND